MAADGRARVPTPRAVVVLLWAAATLFELAVAAKIGPVVPTVSQRHGVRLSDLLALAVSCIAVFVITLRVRSSP